MALGCRGRAYLCNYYGVLIEAQFAWLSVYTTQIPHMLHQKSAKQRRKLIDLQSRSTSNHTAQYWESLDCWGGTSFYLLQASPWLPITAGFGSFCHKVIVLRGSTSFLAWSQPLVNDRAGHNR